MGDVCCASGLEVYKTVLKPARQVHRNGLVFYQTNVYLLYPTIWAEVNNIIGQKQHFSSLNNHAVNKSKKCYIGDLA